MTGKYFNFGDVLGYGWGVMKANFWFFVGLGFVFMTVSYLPTLVRLMLKGVNLPRASYITAVVLLIILEWVINIVLAIGLIKIALCFCEGQRPLFGTLFNAADCFWRYLGAGILYALIIYAGFILLIIPGIIWSVKFGLCFYFVVDKGLGPIAALKASSRTTMGVKWRLFGFWIFCGLINILGVLCLFVGVFAAYPTVLVASALLYRQLLAQTAELAEFGIGSTDVPPNPNWAPLPDGRQF